MWCSGSTMDCYFSDPGSTPTSACWQVTIVRLADDGFFCTWLSAVGISTIPQKQFIIINSSLQSVTNAVNKEEINFVTVFCFHREFDADDHNNLNLKLSMIWKYNQNVLLPCRFLENKKQFGFNKEPCSTIQELKLWHIKKF